MTLAQENLFTLAGLAAECLVVELESYADQTPDTDRGQCLEMRRGTIERCEGRMVVHYETFSGQVGWPVWTCTECGKVRIP